jgi:uncharacterized protein involved in cysteine biosynthesis
MGELLENISRFPKFFAVVILGTLASFFSPLAPFMKNPVTAIAVIGVFVGSFLCITFTLRAMLGLDLPS